MTKYVKLDENGKITFSPRNKNGIINYNRNTKLLKADGYKELEETTKPIDGRKYEITYSETDDKIIEVINYLETEEQYEKRIKAEEINIQIEKLNTQINELDIKRIRAICEPSVKDETTGETWLDYYNSQVAQIRKNIQDLKGTLTNDITE